MTSFEGIKLLNKYLPIYDSYAIFYESLYNAKFLTSLLFERCKNLKK